MLLFLISQLLVLSWLGQVPDAAPSPEYLADRSDLMAYWQQTWGELGFNVCAHAPNAKGLPLQIGDQRYARGLGHHAAGEILIDLDGAYERFEAEVGVQPLPNGRGSVAFQVLVDDRVAFESGKMLGGEPAKSISVSLAGAAELRLVAGDGGDGFNCDCANWADARLLPARTPVSAPVVRRLDAAPFARVVTSDPARKTGCAAARTEEYRREDVYFETDLVPDGARGYTPPAAADGRRVAGLRWLERRPLKQLGLEFAAAHPAPDPQGAEIEYWVGESAWQGRWQPLAAKIQLDGQRWKAVIDWKKSPEFRQGTRRIRWILPASAGAVAIRKFTALSPTPLAEATVRIEVDPAAVNRSSEPGPSEIHLYNGEWVPPAGAEASEDNVVNLPDRGPSTLKLRYARPRLNPADRTVLRFRLPGGAFGVAVDDVIERGPVYVKPYGVLVSRAATSLTLAEYRRQIAQRETILQEVRRLPDQTLAQAIAKVHNPVQNLGPTLLSLACDNHKYVVQRDGTTQFGGDLPKPDESGIFAGPRNTIDLRPRLGSGRNEGLTRKLEGGWLPLIVNEVREGGMVYRQRSYVVPMDDQPLPAPGWLSPRPLCVREFIVENTGDQPADAAIELSFQPSNQGPAISASIAESRLLVVRNEQLAACVDFAEARSLQSRLEGTALSLRGSIPAHGTARCYAYLPGWTLAPADHAQLAGGAGLAARVQPYWEHVLAPAARITLPDELLTNVIKASQVHCLIAARNEADGRRVAAWIASMHYGPLESEANAIIRGMDYLGHHEFARRAHDYFIHRYNAAGFLTTGYTLMGTGWQLWTMGEHFELTHDTAWLGQVAPEAVRVRKWIMAQREKTKKLDAFGNQPPEFGLMPPGVMADWNAYAYHFCLNAYYYAALHETAKALAAIQDPEAKTMADQAAEFREAILRAYRWSQARMPVLLLGDGSAVPGYPSQVHSPGPTNNFFPGEDGNRSWCYDVELGAHQLVPTGVLEAGAPEVAWMMDHHEDVQFLADGWFDFPAERNRHDPFNFGGFAKVQPYYCRNAEVYAMRDELKPFIRSYFNTIPSLLNFENLSFEEHFARVAAWNKTHETGYFLHQSRLMLVREQGEALWLAPFVTSNWMKNGGVVSVENAPTRFGPVGFRIVSHVAEGYIEATITPPQRTRPELILLRLRHPEGLPMKSVTVDGAEHRDFDAAREYIRLTPASAPLVVRAAY